VTAKGNRSKSVKGLPMVIPVEEPCKGKPSSKLEGFPLRRKRDLYFLFYAFNNKDSAILNSRVSILNLKKSNFF